MKQGLLLSYMTKSFVFIVLCWFFATTSVFAQDPCTVYMEEACTQPMTEVSICPEFCLSEPYEILDAHTTFHCSIGIEGECITYIPLPGFTAIDSVAVFACLTAQPEVCDTAYYFVSVLDDCSGFDTSPEPCSPEPVNATICVGDNESINICPNHCTIGAYTINSFTATNEGNVVLAGGCIQYSLNNSFEGTDVITLESCNSLGNCDVSQIFVEVTTCQTNNPPVAGNDEATTTSGTPVNINLISNDTDPDGDLLSIATFGQPTNGTVSVLNGIATYTPGASFTGTDAFTYQVCDEEGECANATVMVEVEAGTIPTVNNPPVAVDDSSSSVDGAATTINVIQNDSDPDGDPITAQTVSQPGNGSVTFSGGIAVYTPDAGYLGTDSFTYQVCDAAGLCDIGVVVIQVVTGTTEPENMAPIAQNDSGESMDGSVVNINLIINDTDPDGDILTVQSSTDPSNGTVILNGNTIQYIPDAGFQGTDAFTYEVCDPSGACATATVSVVSSVTPTSSNQAPVAQNDSGTSVGGAMVSVNILNNDSDPDGDVLSVSSITQPINGILVLLEDVVQYTPNIGFEGIETLLYQVCDDEGLCSSATVSINVMENVVIIEEPNQAPVAQDDSGVSDGGSTVTINMLQNDVDPDGNPLEVVSFSQPNSGSIVVVDGIVEYTPFEGFEGEDSFNYQICDDANLCSTGTVSIQVTNNISEGCNNSSTVCTDPLTTIQICPEFCKFEETDEIAINSLRTTFLCSLVDVGNGCFEYRSLPLFTGSETVTVIAQNGFGILDTAFVTVDVSGCGGVGGTGGWIYLEENSDAKVANPNTDDVAETVVLAESLVVQNTTNETWVSFSTTEENATIQLRSITGQLMAEKRIEAVAGHNQLRFETNHYAKGIYLVTVQTASAKASTKFVK